MLNKRFFRRFIFSALILGLISPQTPAQPAEAGPLTAVSLENLAIDESLGKVEERSTQNGGRIIIQIQDVHAHYAAQENIAAILEHLNSAFGINKVALEGAWTSTDLPKSRAIPTSREKQLLARSLLEEDLISGPVYAALLSPSPLTLAGIEDAGLYEKNREIFLKHLSLAGGIEDKLKNYGDRLRQLQKSSWNAELLSFGESVEKFRETSDLGIFFPALIKTADSLAINFSDLDQLVLVRGIMDLEKRLSKKRLEAEVQQLTRQYRNTSLNLEELIRSGRVPPEKISLYPELKKLTELYKMRDRISLQGLMGQVETLTVRILKKLVKTEEERALWDKGERFYLAEKILLLRTTPADLAAFEDERAVLETELRAAGLGEETALSLEFYDLVKKRDDVFFDKLMNDPSLAGNVAIVTGGFHTAGLSERLHDAGISYITVSPDLGGTTMDQKLYETRMMDEGPAPFSEHKKGAGPRSVIQSGARSATLSELRNAVEWVDEHFIEAYEVLLRTKDVRKAVASFTEAPVAVPPSGKTPSLRDSGRPQTQRAGKPEVPVPGFSETEFMKKSRPEQLAEVRGWLTQIENGRAMLISSIGILKDLLEEPQTEKYLEHIQKSNDVLALRKDMAGGQIPELLRESDRIKYFDAVDFDLLVRKATAKFTKYPPVIMRAGYQSERYVTLPELPVSLVLYRVVALSPELYRAAKNPEFLILLQSLVMEILSERITEKAA